MNSAVRIPANKLGLALRAEALRRSFHEFSLASWSVTEPGTQYLDNWHLEVIDEHLQAVTRGKIKRLIINIPPRTMKSTKVGVQWPAWEWTQKPELQYLTACHADALAIRDSYKARLLMGSTWYQDRFGEQVEFQTDQNEKRRYVNSKMGARVVTSVGASAIGEGGNRIIVDDPHDPLQALSDVQRKTVTDWWDGVMVTRFNQPTSDVAVIVMQRLHELDLSGHLLKKEPGVWEHLKIPMRYEGEKLSTCLGEYDPRTEVGELLWPERFPEKYVKGLERSLGSYGTAGQLQQRPAPLGGGIFKRGDWKLWTVLPQLEEIVLSVDCAFKDLSSSDYVAIQVWGRRGADKFLLKRVKDKLGFGATVRAVRTVHALFPKSIAVLVEDKANGSAVIETLKHELPGVLAIEPEGGKVARAFACQPEHEAGNIYIPDPSIDPDIETFIGETASFPNAPNDDETDAMTQAINWFRTRERTTGIIAHARNEVEARKKAADDARQKAN